LLAAMGSRPSRVPRVRVVFSPAAAGWCRSSSPRSSTSFRPTPSGFRAGNGRLLSPWLHTSALPVFAVLACPRRRRLGRGRRLARRLRTVSPRRPVAHAHRAIRASQTAPVGRATDARAPRRLFGLAFESRPPPVPA
jgi:hypothetical protein